MSFLKAKIKWQNAQVELQRGIITQDQFDEIEADYLESQAQQPADPDESVEPLVAPETRKRGGGNKPKSEKSVDPPAPVIPPVETATGAESGNE